MQKVGTEEMLDLSLLPLLKTGITAHYEGSIDKKGGNDDFDWWLYQQENGEWVIFECEGAGCLYNFVQHRYIESSEVVFRFYFNGEKEPRFELTNSQFGEVWPLTEPLASRYIGPEPYTRGPIRVVRSFVPMEFEKGLKITSSVKLEGWDKTLGHGGWGHVVFHKYTEPTSVKTFEKHELDSRLHTFAKNLGDDIFKPENVEKAERFDFVALPDKREILFRADGAGTVYAIRLKIKEYSPKILSSLWLSATWDGHEKPDVNVPFGAMFCNELGYNSVRYRVAGMSVDGDFYFLLPMPFLQSGEISVVNIGDKPVEFMFSQIKTTQDFNSLYFENEFGYFRASDYFFPRVTSGSDSIIAEVKGSGNIIGSVITGRGKNCEYCSCEGDVRVYIDGLRTPQIESDGSESYSCYGWGFPTPPETHPFGGYDGFQHQNWSMTRFCLGDYYPFYEGFRFGIESGPCNDEYVQHSGTVFYYGAHNVRQRFISRFEKSTEELTSYFEGDYDDISLAFGGSYSKEPYSFSVNVPRGCKTLRIRRVSDQKIGRQKARVFVNGEETAYPWYYADRNQHKRWLEDDFDLPSAMISGKSRVTIEIRPVDGFEWNFFGYEVLAIY